MKKLIIAALLSSVGMAHADDLSLSGFATVTAGKAYSGSSGEFMGKACPCAIGNYEHGAVYSGGAWWCAERPDRLLVLSDPSVGDRVRAVLAARVARRSAVTVADRSDDLAALALVGVCQVCGRLGYRAGRMPRSEVAIPSSPATGLVGVGLGLG